MSKAKGGLGKGFGALLGESLFAESEADGGVSTLPMTLIEPNREQPRKTFEPEAMQTRSIAMHGVVTPITVRKTDGEYYQIIAGERRWRAARSAGLTEIPALVIEADDKTVMELALIENLQRQDLNPVEEAQGYQSLMEEYGLTQEQVAERVGKSRPAVANALRLLALPESAQEMVASGTLSAGHARAVLAIKDESLRTPEVLEKMAGMSVRQAEKFAKNLTHTAEEQNRPHRLMHPSRSITWPSLRTGWKAHSVAACALNRAKPPERSRWSFTATTTWNVWPPPWKHCPFDGKEELSWKKTTSPPNRIPVKNIRSPKNIWSFMSSACSALRLRSSCSAMSHRCAQINA